MIIRNDGKPPMLAGENLQVKNAWLLIIIWNLQAREQRPLVSLLTDVWLRSLVPG